MWLPWQDHLRDLCVDALIPMLLVVETIANDSRVSLLISTVSFLVAHFDEQWVMGYQPPKYHHT